MQDFSICHFVPYHKDQYSIHTISFVLEKKVTDLTIFPATESLYKMHCVCRGEGFLRTAGQLVPLKVGDIFFTFPSVAYTLEAKKDFEYMYIGFLGSRANMIMEKLKISRKNFLFHGFEDVIEVWLKGLNVIPEVTDLMSESVLLHTFSLLGQKLLDLSNREHKCNRTAATIKKYIDDHFQQPDFSLDDIGCALSYNKKYVSTIFKDSFGIGVIDYLNTIRIQHACTMMEQGFTSVCDISARCGYADPQYFSRLFKTKMGMPPAKYMKSL